MKYLFKATLLLLTLLAPITAMAQHRTVRGIVTDDSQNNDPLVGASVIVTGVSGGGVVTDIDGRFSLPVNDGDKSITVSYLGYKSVAVSIIGRDSVTVVMHTDAHQVGEVVVTGYQQIERRKLTAAISTIDISDETVGAITNIDQALAGQVAGLSSVTQTGAPGAPVKIRIRGTASINGTQDPLWVLDGMPLEGTDIPAIDNLNDIDDIYQTSIAGLNPSDIANITVLKDAAATAIYGARAANGVIVVTTKKGKEGRPIVNFTAKLTYSPRQDIGRLNLLNSNEKVDLELQLMGSDYSYRQNKGGVAQILSALGETDAYKAGGWDALSAIARKQINDLRNINTDWNKILFRNVLNQEYNASISGGSEKANYYSSIGIDKEAGTVRGTANRRYNITLKADYRINRMLKLGTSVYANERKQDSYLTDTNGFTNPVYYSRLANPYFAPYAADGSYNYDTNVQGKEDSSLDFNIFEERTNTGNRRKDRSLMAVFDAQLDIQKGLKLTSQLGLQYDNYSLSRYAGENSYAMRKTHLNAQYTYSDGKRSFLPDGGMHRTTDYHSTQWTWKTMLEYTQRIAEIHELQVMAGAELRHSENNSVTSTAYGYDPKTLTVQPVIFPTENIAESYPLHSEAYNENAYVSWFATGSYTLLNRYTVGGSVRWDGSDVFGVAKKYRFLPLYSASGLWRISKEPWMKATQEWLDNLSIRASYGIQGNIDKNTSPYLIGSIDKTTILPGNSEYVIAAEIAPNPDLRWEKTRNVNIGVDMGFLDDAVKLTADYYYRKSTDLIGSRQLPLETGFSSTTINWASMENRGWEFALSTRNIHTHDFTWTTNLNIGVNNNKILHESVAENTTYPSREGYPVGALFALRTAGLDDEGYPLYLDKEGAKVTLAELMKLNSFGASTLTAAEQRDLYEYMGATDPKVSGGFMNHFGYKNWQLGINLVFNFGMKVRVQPSYMPATYDRGLNTNREIFKRWTSGNTSGTMPALMKPGYRGAEYVQYSEYNIYSMLDTWVRSCNYVRLQSLRLGYKFPKTLMRYMGVQALSLSLEARNLFAIASNYDNYLDPETMGNPFAQPVSRQFVFGMNVTF